MQIKRWRQLFQLRLFESRLFESRLFESRLFKSRLFESRLFQIVLGLFEIIFVHDKIFENLATFLKAIRNRLTAHFLYIFHGLIKPVLKVFLLVPKLNHSC
jgi:hypothetical protein